MKKLHAVILSAAAVCCFSASRSFDSAASPEEFKQWQENARPFFSRILYGGEPPQAVDLGPAFSKTETRQSYELAKVSFADRPGHVTTGLAGPTGRKSGNP